MRFFTGEKQPDFPCLKGLKKVRESGGEGVQIDRSWAIIDNIASNHTIILISKFNLFESVSSSNKPNLHLLQEGEISKFFR